MTEEYYLSYDYTRCDGTEHPTCSNCLRKLSPWNEFRQSVFMTPLCQRMERVKRRLVGGFMSKEIDELLSVDFEEIESSLRTQVMAKALYVIGSIVVTALAHKDTASKEDLLEAIRMVYDSVCESAALVELTSETVVH